MSKDLKCKGCGANMTLENKVKYGKCYTCFANKAYTVKMRGGIRRI